MRILTESYRRSVIAKNSDVVPTVLVGGVVAARWGARLAGRTAVLAIATFQRLSASDRAAVTAEGEGLIRLIHPDARAHQVRFVSSGALPLTNLSLKP